MVAMSAANRMAKGASMSVVRSSRRRRVRTTLPLVEPPDVFDFVPEVTTDFDLQFSLNLGEIFATPLVLMVPFVAVAMALASFPCPLLAVAVAVAAEPTFLAVLLPVAFFAIVSKERTPDDER